MLLRMHDELRSQEQSVLLQGSTRIRVRHLPGYRYGCKENDQGLQIAQIQENIHAKYAKYQP